MAILKYPPDTSNEFILQRCYNGIKLIRPDESFMSSVSLTNSNSYHTVKSIMQLPINVYFMDTASRVQNFNESAINACGYGSLNKALYKTIYVWANKEAAELSLNHDYNVLKFNSMKIEEENYERLTDGLSYQAISIKFPWYDCTNTSKIIGIFGFSIIMNGPYAHSFADALNSISSTGLLNPYNSPANIPSIIPGRFVNGKYLSKRESECLFYLLQGMSAKSIARIIGISPRTVEAHLEAIKIKIGVSSKIELIEVASKYTSLLPKNKGS